MKTEKLSPDELNGLLGQGGAEEKASSSESLTKVENEALLELLSVSLGSSANVLSALFSGQVNVMARGLAIKHKDSLLTNEQPIVVALGEYSGYTIGLQVISITKADVAALVKLMEASSGAESLEAQFQSLQEVIDQMFAAATQSMSMVLDHEISHSLLSMDVIEEQEGFPVSKFTKEEWFVEASIQIKVAQQTTAAFNLAIPVPLAKQLVGILIDGSNEEHETPEETQEMPFQTNNQSNEPAKNIDSESQPNIQSVQFSSFDETAAASSEPNNLNMLLDIPLQVTVELGRTKRMVKEILEVSQGSIIELDKLAGEPVDILINNKLIAVGEVVVIDENFGVRVTDILSTADRISKLR